MQNIVNRIEVLVSEDTVSFETFMKGRAALYSVLSTLFSECIRYDRIELLYQIVANFVEAVDPGEGKNELNNSAVKVLSWLTTHNSNKDNEEFNLDLAREHAALFALGKHKVPDTASAILSRDCLVKREQWESCKAFYWASGFALPQGSGKYEDSFEVQCKFMEALIEKTLSETEEGAILELLATQVKFLEGHILTWIGVFGQQLRDQTHEESIYNAIALLPSVLLELDRENMAALLD